VLFVCENNLYAASTSFKKAFKINSVAERADAYGMPGVVVDGNDVLAVYRAATEAAERARAGRGPTLIECLTYRQCGHSRSDPRTYRSKEEEEEWKGHDPIVGYRTWLLNGGKASAEQIRQIEENVEQTIRDAIAYGDASPEPTPELVYTHVFR
jgi:TPP-dependent pyruvate/acetoin dehydrogenase alpha subunit